MTETLNPSTEELLESDARRFKTDRLQFVGLRGNSSKHLDSHELDEALARLPPAPRDEGTVRMLVARGPAGERSVLTEAVLTVDGGMPGDRWVNDDKYGPEYQLATTYSRYAEVIANGQPLELHGDNLFFDLDPSAENLPAGSRLVVGEAILEVTPQAHNGCKKWAQRFGLAPMQRNMAPEFRAQRLRGYYLRVIEPGRVRVGDSVRVLRREAAG